MKRLILHNGDNQFAVRRGIEGHSFIKGERIIGETFDGSEVILLITQNTFTTSFLELQSSERLLDRRGFYFDEKHFKRLKEVYPDLAWSDTGVVIFFKVQSSPGNQIKAENSI